MKRIRLGAVSYLNTRPLVYGLDRRSDLFDVRFDVPSRCADLLRDRHIDLGLIPSIEYLRGPEPYTIVPGLGIISEGEVASVALFSRVPIEKIRRIGLDTSSRTSAALIRILCRESWHIDPEFVNVPPSAAVRIQGTDAALVIGDPALFLDYRAAGFDKIDLGAEWTGFTGLPFVWAIWAGREGAIDEEAVGALQEALERGVAASDEIADAYCKGRYAGHEALCRRYLRENIRYKLGDREQAALARYYELAGDGSQVLRFYGSRVLGSGSRSGSKVR